MSLGKNVRALRLARGWELEDLSRKSGVKVGTISAIEMRESKRSQFAPQLAAAFELTVERLMANEISVCASSAFGEGEMLPTGGKVEASNVTALPAPALRGLDGVLAELQAVVDGLSPLLQVAARAVLRQWLDGQAGRSDVVATIEGLQQIGAGMMPGAENRAA
jgi:hypothetical protein